MAPRLILGFRPAREERRRARALRLPHCGISTEELGHTDHQSPRITRRDRLFRAASRRRTVPRVSLMLIAAVVLVAGCGESTSTSTAGHLTLNTGAAPWPEPDRVPQRVAAAGLPHGETESLAVHYHAHLDIIVNGKSEPVAASIGREDQSFFSPLHTHATSGLIHIEAAKDQRFTLGMLFMEWGVRLTLNCVGGYCRPGTPISTYVDGHRAREPLPDIVLTKGREIALVIGSPPSSIPSGWDCRAKINPAIENPAQCADFGQ